MSRWTKITKPIRHVGSVIDHGLKHADSWLRNHNAPDVYIGYNGGYYLNVKPNQPITVQPKTTNSRKPTAYTRNVAQQGGMTKEEVEQYNIKHPNEIAIGGYNG